MNSLDRKVAEFDAQLSESAAYVESISVKNPRTPLQTLDISKWQETTPKPRAWVLPDWIPKGTVTGLGGIGGASKSTLALQMCIHQAAGWPFLGQQMEKAPALFVSCEDDADELHRRTAQIAAGMGIEIRDFAENLHIIERVGEDAVLVAPLSSRPGSMERTDRYHELDQILGDLRIELCALDLLPDFWVGNENDRGQVNALVKNHMGHIAKRHHMGLLCLYHPSRVGQSTGTGESGSTAWDGSFRSRLYLEFDKENDKRELKRMKANYAPLDDVELTWRNGYLVEPSSLNISKGDEQAASWETDFLTALQYCDDHNIEVSAAPNSKYSYKKLFPEVLKNIDGRRRWARGPQLDKAYSRAIVGGTIYETERTTKRRARLHFKGYDNGR